MLKNITDASDLRSLARSRARDFVTKTVNPVLVDEAIADGWSIAKRSKRTVQMMKKKRHGDYFADRVWVLLYRMGFPLLSSENEAGLVISPKDPDSPVTRIDVVAVDEEVALAIECKSSLKYAKRPEFQEELGKHALIRQQFAQSVNAQFPAPFKRQVAIAMFTSNINLTDNDHARAQSANVVLFDEQDLEYYEGLIVHLGEAAKYQFLADLLPGKPIAGLTLRIPAIRTRMGEYNCYTFSVTPEYLLKIAYVSHRAKGKASDVNTYQRLVRKSRLKKIREYIDNDGMFPTNIVVNLDKSPRFDQVEADTQQQSGKMGWLELRPAYKSAWIIDGQHRLFAYSGHSRAAKSRLAVLAFDGLPAPMQAELFIDINAQQKSVKRSLLDELYAELHWNAEEPEARVRAIVSKAIQVIDSNPESPFYQRILFADDAKGDIRCISLTSLFKAIVKPELYVHRPRKGASLQYGPLWGGESNDATRLRTEKTIDFWFDAVRKEVPEWWNVGSGHGGGIAMNDGVTACIGVLRSIFQHLEIKNERLERLNDEELIERIQPYATALAKYLGTLNEEDRKGFRDLRGIQGITTRMRRCQQGIKEQIGSYDPPGLAEFMSLEKSQTNQKAKTIVDHIEETLQQTIIEELHREHGLDESEWWINGVPRAVRKSATARYEEDDGKRGGKEYYFDLIDYRTIITQNWQLLGGLFGYTKAGAGKDKRTAWIIQVNEIRKIVSHVSAGRSVTLEQLSQLEEYDQWMTKQLSSSDMLPAEDSADNGSAES